MPHKKSNMKQDYRIVGSGPGGFFCNCCNPWSCHPRKAKPLSRRYVRRKLKLELKKMED